MDKPPVEEEELNSSWALFILTSLLILSLFTSYYLQHKQIRAVHETVLSIFAGMIVGLVIRVSPGLDAIQKMVTFNYSYFFNLLLPPIILNVGYEMKKENFFRNFGTILTFAFAGTFISALVIGILVGIISAIGIGSMSLSLLDSMIFGSVLSATDAVTVLTVFQTLKVDPKLYSIIFGESILNDAVAIVLYETLKMYRGQDFHFSNIFHGFYSFFINFWASLTIGVTIGVLCALMLKYSRLYKYPSIESCIISLMAYTSYFFSNGINVSGIVSLLFCGVTLKHYAYDNMSLRTKRTTRYMFHVLAQLSENFVFIYLGLTLFTQLDLDYKPLFIVFTAIIICISRYSAVFPLSRLINAMSRYRKKSEAIPHKYSVMLFWAGLRGAVAFALAAGLEGENANAMKTTILVVVVLSVIVFGGTTSRVLEIMKVQTGVEEGDDDSDDDDAHKEYYYDEDNDEVHYGDRYRDSARRDDSGHGTDTNGTSEVRVQLQQNASRSNNLKKHWFVSFDDRFLKPLFTRNDRDFKQLDHRSSHVRWDHERRHDENEEDFVGLIGESVRDPLNNSSRNNNNNNNSTTSYRDGGDDLNNRDNQRIEFTDKQKNNVGGSSRSSENSSSSVQQQDHGDATNSGSQSYRDLSNLLIDKDKDESNGNLMDLQEFQK